MTDQPPEPTTVPLDQIPTDAGLCVVHGDRNVALFRLGDEIVAIDDLCSHAEASLAEGFFEPEDSVIECPRHGAEFDLRTGEALTRPATERIATYSVTQADGHVAIGERTNG